MGGVEDALDFVKTVFVLASRDIFLGEIQIREDAFGVRPLTEEIIVLEEMVVAEAGMRHHKRLHGHGVFFHEIGDAGIGIDHDLIGEALITALIELLVAREVLAEGPVLHMSGMPWLE